LIVILRLLAIKVKMINKLLLPGKIKMDHYQMEQLLIIELNRKPITILNRVKEDKADKEGMEVKEDKADKEGMEVKEDKADKEETIKKCR
jgi:hypothetical protein